MITIILVIIFSSFVIQENEFTKSRTEMVEKQIRNRGIEDKSTLSSIGKVPRHKFVPQNLIRDAYSDSPLPIGYGQTISQPYIVAYMTEALKLKSNYKVLEIGTGSGYQAAVLAEIVDTVCTIEIIRGLFDQSSKRLIDLGYKNIFTKNSDGYFGWKEFAPFDAIIVTAAAEYIPPPLIKQLTDGGKMIIPVGTP